MPKIFVYWPTTDDSEEAQGIAYAEDGEPIAHHISSNVSWFRRDMGLMGNWKHELYRAKYPDGFELVAVIGREAMQRHIDAGDVKNLSFGAAPAPEEADQEYEPDDIGRITVFAFQELPVNIVWITRKGAVLRRQAVLFDVPPDDVVEVAKIASAKIELHDFKRIAGALGLAESESTTIDRMVEKIEFLRKRAGY